MAAGETLLRLPRLRVGEVQLQLQHAVVVKACCMASGQAHDTLPFAR